MTEAINHKAIERIQSHLKKLETMIPDLAETEQPAGRVWSNVYRELEKLAQARANQDPLPKSETQEVERERRLAETDALYRGSQAIAKALTERQIFDAFFEQIRGQNPCEISVYRFSHVDDRPTWARLTVNWQKRDNPTYPTGTRFYLPEVAQANLLTGHDPLFIDDIAGDARLSPKERDSFAPTGACSVAILPLLARGQELGAVMVHFTSPYTFTEATRRLWLALADLAAAGLANHQLLQNAAYHMVQMETAAEVARAASSILDLQELLNSTVALVGDRFDLYYVGAFLVDEAKKWAVLRAGTGQAGQIQLEKGHRLEIGGESMIGWSIQHRQPRIALDVGQDAVHFQNPDLPETRSEMALPFIHGTEAIGALTIQSVEPAAFSRQDIIFLQLMADQLANAIQNARLFEQAQQEIVERKQIEQEITRRNEELAAINRVTTAVTSTLDLEDMLESIAREMVDIFQASRCGIALLNDDQTELTMIADYAADPKDATNLGAVIPLAGNPSSIQVVETGRPLVVTEAQTNPLTAPIHQPLRERGTQCLMIVPVIVRGEVMGTIGVDLAQVGREFSPAEVKLAETIAAQISSAIENARLFEETQAALTERQRAEEALRASEAKYRELVEHANSIIFRMDTEGCVTFFNEFAQSFFGYTEAEILGRNVVGTIVPKTESTGRNLAELIDGVLTDPEQYARNENENMRHNGDRVWVLWTNKAILDGEGRINEILCIGSDVTERRQAEEALRESEALYVSLVESLPQNIFRKDLAGRFTFANQSFCDIEGKSRAEIIGKTDFDLYPAELARKYQEDDRRVIEAGEIFEIAEKHPMPDGETGYVRVVKIPIYDSAGKVTGIQGMFWDITERQRAQEALQFQKTLLEAQGEASPDGIMVVSKEREILSANRRFAEMWGIPEKVMETGSSLAALEAVKDKVVDSEAFQARVAYLYEHIDQESREEIELEDGRLLDRYSAPVKSPQGVYYGRVWYFRDITDHKQQEEALAGRAAELEEARNFLDSIIENIPITIFVKDAPDLKFVRWNKAGEELVGLDRDEMIGKSDYDFFPKEEADFFTAKDREVLNQGKFLDIPEETIQTVRKGTRLLHTRKVPIFDSKGQPKYLLGLSVDITERKQAEKALRESEEKYRTVLESIEDGYYETDIAGNITFFNHALPRILGYPPHELMGMNNRTFTDEANARKLYEAFNKVYRTGKPARTVEWEVIRKDGQSRYIECSASLIKDKDDQAVGFRGVARDVTERKEFEETLRKNEERFRRIYNNTPVMLHSIDQTGRLVSVSDYWLEALGYERSEVIGRRPTEFLTEESRRYAQEVALPKFFKIGYSKDIPYQFVKKNGEIIDVLLSGTAEFNQAGELQRSLTVLVDVTELKKAQKALAEERNLLRALTDNLPDYIYVKDKESRFLLANEPVRRHLGAASVEEVVGKTDFDFSPQELAEKYYADEQALLESGEPLIAHEEPIFDHASGAQRWVLTTKVPFRDSQGNVAGLVGLNRDITEIKKAEEALQLTQFSVDHAPDAIFWVGPDAGIQYVNEGATHSLGYSQEELLSMKIYDIDPNFTAEIWPDHWQKLKQSGSHLTESQHLARDGRPIPVDIRINYFEFNGKEYHFAFARDITPRKHAEEALQEALRKTQILYNISESLATLTDQQAAFETVLGEYLLLLRLERGGLMLFDQASGHHYLQALYIDGKVTEPNLKISPEDDLVARHLIENPAPLVIEDADTHPLTKDTQSLRGTVGSMLLIPLVARSQVVGVLGADALEKGHHFHPDDIELGRAIADQLTIWLENLQLLKEAQHRSALLQTGAEVSKAASSLLDVDKLIDTSVNLIRDKFDFYYVGLFLVDDARQWAVLRAGTGRAGRIQLEKGHRLEIGGESMIGWSIQRRQARIALDVGKDPVQFKNPHLPDTHSEMALPLISRDEVIGALTVQSVERRAFSDEDITVLQTMADQLANAIKNANLFENVAHSQQTAEVLLQETQALHQLSQALAATLSVNEILDLFFQACTQDIGFEYVMFSLVDTYQGRIKAIAGVGLPDSQIKRSNRSLDSEDIMVDIIKTGHTEVITGWDDRFNKETYEAEGHADWVRVFTPITLRQEHIGLVEAGFNKNSRAHITDPQLRLLRAFIDQTALALDNAQRYEASQRVARRETQIKDIIAKVSASTDLDTILQTTVKEVGDAIGGKRSYIHLISATNGEAEDR